MVYDSFRNVNQAVKSPTEGLEWIFNVLNTIHTTLKRDFNYAINKTKWSVHKQAFKNFTRVRQVPAHQKSFIEIDSLKEEFSEYYTLSSMKLKEIQKGLKLDYIPSFLKQPFEDFVENLEITFFLNEIGRGVLKYLALVDQILYFLLNNKNQQKN